MYYGYGGLSGYIWILPALIFSLYASTKLTSAYSKYGQMRSNLGMTGEQVAKAVLRRNNISDISVTRTSGTLTDHYDSRNKIIALSDAVYSGSSIASIAVAAHEAGHAVQLAEGYLPLKIRHTMVGITSIATSASYLFIMLGLFINETFALVGIIMFGIIFIFQVVTLPVEYNASNRAVAELVAIGADQQDEEASKKMLNAAALTYVAAMVTALLELLRVIAMFGNRRRRN